MRDSISLVWHIDDVLHQAKEDGHTLTKKEAREVLSSVESNHDCNFGVSWDTIRWATEELIEERDNNKKEA